VVRNRRRAEAILRCVAKQLAAAHVVLILQQWAVYTAHARHLRAHISKLRLRWRHVALAVTWRRWSAYVAAARAAWGAGSRLEKRRLARLVLSALAAWIECSAAGKGRRIFLGRAIRAVQRLRIVRILRVWAAVTESKNCERRKAGQILRSVEARRQMDALASWCQVARYARYGSLILDVP
jgi:hypothetical protein